MESLIFAVNAVVPIILMVALGYFLRRIGLVNSDFAKRANKLVFRVFLPVMLAMNVYGIDSSMDIGIGYLVFAVIAILIIFAASIFLSKFVTKVDNRRAPIIQAVFRSNFALIGIPLAQSFYGAEGAAVASLLSAVSIPLYNILAVLVFAIFGKGEKPNVKDIIKNIITNPLIIGVAVGGVLLLAKNTLPSVGVEFELSRITPVYKVLTYLSGMATPLALIALGAQFEFSAIPGMKKEIIFSTLMRILIVPVVIITIAILTGWFSGAHIAAFVALFATPVAVSSAPMAQELGGDFELAGQVVVWTTFFSGITLFLFSFVLNAIGVFV